MLKNLKAYFKLLRIKEWRAYFLMAAFGFIIVKGFLFPVKEIFLFWLMVFLFLAFGFSSNDCFDTQEDKYHQDKENPLVKKEVNFKKSLFFSILIGVFGLILSIFFGIKVFLFCLIGVLIGFFYSAPPLRLKSRPFLDIISHGFFAGAFIFILPVIIFGKELNLIYYLLAFSIFYFSGILELRNHLEDFETDKRAKLKTTALFLGYKNSEKLLRYSVILYPLILLPIFLLIPQNLLFPFFILSLIFFLLFLFSEDYQLINPHTKQGQGAESAKGDKVSPCYGVGVKNYRILDFYSAFSFVLLLIGLL